MKIKITDDKPNSGMGSIKSLFGNNYKVVEELAKGAVLIHVPEWEGFCTVFENEYIIVEK